MTLTTLDVLLIVICSMSGAFMGACLGLMCGMKIIYDKVLEVERHETS